MATTSTIREALRDLFYEPALAHVSYLNRKGQIVTYPMWVDFDGEHLVVSSPVGSRKGKALRERPQVAISIVSTKNPWHWLSVSGRVATDKQTQRSVAPVGWLRFWEYEIVQAITSAVATALGTGGPAPRLGSNNPRRLV